MKRRLRTNTGKPGKLKLRWRAPKRKSPAPVLEAELKLAGEEKRAARTGKVGLKRGEKLGQPGRKNRKKELPKRTGFFCLI